MPQKDGETALEREVRFLGMTKDHLEWQNRDEEKRQVNVRLPAVEFQLLERLSEHFGENRTSLAQRLLSAAILDACVLAGVDTNYRSEATAASQRAL
jgi:hypothetical protein